MCIMMCYFYLEHFVIELVRDCRPSTSDKVRTNIRKKNTSCMHMNVIVIDRFFLRLLDSLTQHTYKLHYTRSHGIFFRENFCRESDY